MKQLEWREEFSLGIPEVDHEHRELIALVNAACVALDRHSPATQIDATLGDLHARVAAHFALEEKQMAARQYPDRAPHKADHEALLDTLRDFMDEYAAQGVLDEEAFASRLGDWFSVHFSTHDARLHHFLAGAGLGT